MGFVGNGAVDVEGPDWSDREAFRDDDPVRAANILSRDGFGRIGISRRVRVGETSWLGVETRYEAHNNRTEKLSVVDEEIFEANYTV